jgi:hypothetical protein
VNGCPVFTECCWPPVIEPEELGVAAPAEATIPLKSAPLDGVELGSPVPPKENFGTPVAETGVCAVPDWLPNPKDTAVLAPGALVPSPKTG